MSLPLTMPCMVIMVMIPCMVIMMMMARMAMSMTGSHLPSWSVLGRLVSHAAGMLRHGGRYDTSADAAKLLYVAAVLVEGSLQMGATGCIGLVPCRVVLMRVILRLCITIRQREN